MLYLIGNYNNNTSVIDMIDSDDTEIYTVPYNIILLLWLHDINRICFNQIIATEIVYYITDILNALGITQKLLHNAVSQ